MEQLVLSVMKYERKAMSVVKSKVTSALHPWPYASSQSKEVHIQLVRSRWCQVSHIIVRVPIKQVMEYIMTPAAVPSTPSGSWLMPAVMVVAEQNWNWAGSRLNLPSMGPAQFHIV